MEEANNGEESEEDWSDVDDEGCINARPSSRSKKQNRWVRNENLVKVQDLQ